MAKESSVCNNICSGEEHVGKRSHLHLYWTESHAVMKRHILRGRNVHIIHWTYKWIIPHNTCRYIATCQSVHVHVGAFVHGIWIDCRHSRYAGVTLSGEYSFCMDYWFIYTNISQTHPVRFACLWTCSYYVFHELWLPIGLFQFPLKDKRFLRAFIHVLRVLVALKHCYHPF